MALPNYSQAAIRAAQLAGRIAARAGAKKVEPEHLLVALLKSEKGIRAIFAEMKMDAAALAPQARELAHATAVGQRTRPRLSARMEKILMRAEDEAKSFSARAIDVHHLLLALLREGGPAAKFLGLLGADYESVRRATRQAMQLAPPAHCPGCGYDLRATPERCPECGRLV